MLPAWLGSAEALRYSSIEKFEKTLIDMEKNWPFFNSMMDILDMVISKVDPDISKIYEEYLADKDLKRVGKKLRFQFEVIKKLNSDKKNDLNDALLTSIAGISAAMKNTG